MKANSKIFFVLMIVFILLLSITAQADNYITSAETPKEAVSLKWATKIGEGWQKSAGVPTFVDDDIVIISGDELLKVAPEDGKISKRITMAEEQSYGYVAPTYYEDTIYMNLSNGTVQAFDSKTLESKWIYTDSLSGKGMTKVTCSESAVFTGFWNGENKDANFVALNRDTGELKWSKTVNGGFYWAGAYCTDSEVIFATDDGGDKVAHIYSCNIETGEVISCINVENKGDIRSTVTYYNGRIFLTTKGGYIISAALTNGVLSDVKYGEIGAASTSTPVIYKDRIYIGAGDKTISVFDTNTLGKLFFVSVSAYPQCTPLISTCYEEDGYIYLYTTYNKTPGGVTLVKIKQDAISSEDCTVTEIYDAEGYSQYCISDIICDEEGTLYYKNDSGYLFALSDKITVRASLCEDGFIMPQRKLSVSRSIAEEYGYTDQVTGEASALDVLVSAHEYIFGSDFNKETASEYLSVSAEGYLSRVIGMDTYSFGFAVNGKAPHDDVLTDYGYTGYSLNQAVVKNNEKVEFFIYRDSWAMDNYVHFEKDDTEISTLNSKLGEEIKLTLKGYPFGWYSCAEDSQIKNAMTNIGNASITILDSETGIPEEVTVTDENGNLVLSFNHLGKYVISASEASGATPIIAPWFEINITGVNIEIDNNTATIISNLEDETDAILFIAGYSNDCVNKIKAKPVTLQEGYYISDPIDLTDVVSCESLKIFIWEENSLSPLMEVE